MGVDQQRASFPAFERIPSRRARRLSHQGPNSRKGRLGGAILGSELGGGFEVTKALREFSRPKAEIAEPFVGPDEIRL